MEEPREGDCRFPLISSLLCLFVAAGGILLFIYVFRPSVSKPWFPVASFILIGSPWIFWMLTYTYTCMKACVRNRRLYDHQISRRTSSSHARGAATCTGTSSHNKNANGRNESSANNEPSSGSANDDNDDDGKRVHFGGVVVMDRELKNQGHSGGNPPDEQNSSITSSKEIEMPLTLSVSS